MISSSPELQWIVHGPFLTDTERSCMPGSGYLTIVLKSKLQFFKGLFDQSHQFPFIKKKKKVKSFSKALTVLQLFKAIHYNLIFNVGKMPAFPRLALEHLKCFGWLENKK